MPFPNDPHAPAAATQPRIATSSAVRTAQSVAHGVAWRTSRLRDGFRRAAVPCPRGGTHRLDHQGTNNGTTAANNRGVLDRWRRILDAASCAPATWPL